MSAALREAEKDFQRRLHSNPVAQGPVTMGPRGLSLTFATQVTIPWKDFLKMKHPNGKFSVPDEALPVMLEILQAEIADRGIRK